MIRWLPSGSIGDANLRRLIHTIKLKLDDINLLVSLNFKGSAAAAQRYPRSSTVSRTELDGAENQVNETSRGRRWVSSFA
jgi:hypothetical protein